MSDVLFEVKEAQLNTGLRGYPVGTCRTSKVDPYKGVSYCGYPIGELAYCDPEDVVFLLLNRNLPSASERQTFKADLNGRAGIPNCVFDSLRQLPVAAHPMEWFYTGISILGMSTQTGDWMEDARNVIARMPQLVAAIFRLRSGWGEPIAPDPSLGLIENFVHMLGVPGGDAKRLTRLLRTFYILHMDHGGGNLSTFTGKAAASGHAHIYASLNAAMCALYGPLHGRANQDCLNFVRKVGSADPVKVRAFIEKALANKEKIYGFGHAVLRAEDPRATIQYALGQQICGDDPLFQTALVMRKQAVDVLSSVKKISNPYPNVDAVSGTLLNANGLTDSNYYTVLFGLARCTGIAAQIVDERLRLRGGKGVPLYRPKFIAQDQTPRSMND